MRYWQRMEATADGEQRKLYPPSQFRNNPRRRARYTRLAKLNCYWARSCLGPATLAGMH